jgi:hypothetical protein
MGRELPPPLREELDQLLRDRTGEGLSSESAEGRRRKILKKGRIASTAEYELVQNHVHELEARNGNQDEIASMVAMLDAYRPRSK